MLRRIAFVRVAQRVGLTIQEIRDALATLPSGRTPTKEDWARLSRAWKPRLDEQIATLERLRDRLTSCIGCGCLSFKACALYNPSDAAAPARRGAALPARRRAGHREAVRAIGARSAASVISPPGKGG